MLAALAVIAAACSSSSTTSNAASERNCVVCQRGGVLPSERFPHPRDADRCHGQPVYPPWFGGKSVPDRTGRRSPIHREPGDRARARVAPSRTRCATVRASEGPGHVARDPFGILRSRTERLLLRCTVSYHAAAGAVGRLQRRVLRRESGPVANNGISRDRCHRPRRAHVLKLGAQVGTTSYQYIQDKIQPNASRPSSDLDRVIQALNNGQIDGFVVDFPRRASTGRRERLVGQFPPIGGQQEHFGCTFRRETHSCPA